jgi:hypothetical protein
VQDFFAAGFVANDLDFVPAPMVMRIADLFIGGRSFAKKSGLVPEKVWSVISRNVDSLLMFFHLLMNRERIQLIDYESNFTSNFYTLGQLAVPVHPRIYAAVKNLALDKLESVDLSRISESSEKDANLSRGGGRRSCQEPGVPMMERTTDPAARATPTSRPVRVATFDVSRISTAVRRHEALLRYARYLFIFNIVIFLWVAIPQLSQVTSFRGLTELAVGPAWQWAALVLGSVGGTYLILAHRLWWAYAVIFLAQVGYFVVMPSPDKQVLWVSTLMTYSVIILPPMRPLVPLATELAIMNIGFAYIMFVCCLYSATWTASARRVPPEAYGRRPSLFEPLRPSRLLDALLPGHRSQKVTLGEAALFALSSASFVAASMAPFYGLRRVQNAFMAVAAQLLACAREGFPAQPAQATIACWADHYPWSRAAIDLGAPIGVTVVCLVLANRLRHLGRRHFIQRLAELPLSPVGSTLFLRAFRDDQVRIRRASRNLFSSVFDLGRVPTTLDELMLERLDGSGDLIAIGNPQDRKGAARRSPWGAQRLYVDDAHWHETVVTLMRDADRIVLCVDASAGVRWEIAHVLRGGHSNKTLFFLNPSLDVGIRTRLLREDFGVSGPDLASINTDGVLALRLTSTEQTMLVFYAKPERDAYLAVMRLAFKDKR